MIKILTATDGSKQAQRAVRLSCQLAQAQTASLTALTVVDPDKATQFEQISRQIMEVAQQSEVQVSLIQGSGHPDRVIRETALQGYDLLTIGAQGLRSMRDFFFGRNAIRLIKKLPVSTLVVRKSDTIKHILWRIPRGPVHKKHLILVAHIVNSLHAELTLLDVQPNAMLFGHRKNTRQNTTQPCEQSERMAKLRSSLYELSGKEVTCRIRSGIPEEVILDEATIGDYNLVAVSVQPRCGIDKLFAEDLPYRIARNLPVSVLLLN